MKKWKAYLALVTVFGFGAVSGGALAIYLTVSSVLGVIASGPEAHRNFVADSASWYLSLDSKQTELFRNRLVDFHKQLLRRRAAMFPHLRSEVSIFIKDMEPHLNAKQIEKLQDLETFLERRQKRIDSRQPESSGDVIYQGHSGRQPK